ncbi:hypothetical protein ACW73L_13910 [Methylolobus aquaticus]
MGIENIRGVIIAAAVAGLMSGCAAIERNEVTDIEQMLAASGFQIKYADTPDKKAHLQTLTQLKLVPHNENDSVRFIYADAKYCQCLYAGDGAAYQRYQQLAIQKSIADEQRQAAMMNEDAAMNWGMWGPWGW